jgi:[ribosomal protein S18]-alanine N-acetyltransferase
LNRALSPVDLRGGTPADLGLVSTIMRDAFDPRFGEAWTQAQCMGVMSLPGVWLTLAQIDGQPAGFALARATLDEAELLLLATHPGCRRRGVGVSLLRSVIRDARERGVNQLHLEVRADNAAIKLYHAQGFRKVGVRRNYYRGVIGDVFDAHTFNLILSDN